MTQSLSTAKLATIAVALGLLAGAGAVYVKGGVSGNDRSAPMSEEPASIPGPEDAMQATAGESCPLADGQLETLAALATGQVAAMTPQENPVSLAGLAFENPQGDDITLGTLAGKTLLVNLWATWCAPCREEMPALDALQQRAGGDDFAVVTINMDTGEDDKPRDFLNEIGVDSLPLYRDATMGVFNDLKSRGLAFGLPVTLLVDENGCLMAAMNGPADWASDDALKLIEGAKAI